MAGALKDGEYGVDADHFSAKLTSGGSSKVKIECQKVIVKNGKATAWINFSSSKYDKVWVKVNGTQNIYHAKPREGEAGVAFEIPVNLNSSMTFMAHTSSMSGKILHIRSILQSRKIQSRRHHPHRIRPLLRN